MNTIIAILLFLIGLVVCSSGIIFSIWCVKRRRALAAAAGQAQVPAGAAAPQQGQAQLPNGAAAAPQGHVPPPAGAAGNGGAPAAPQVACSSGIKWDATS